MMIDYQPGMTARITPELLTEIGNVDTMKDQFGRVYRYVRRSVKPAGLFVHDRIVLKIYHLIRENTPLEPGSAEGVEPFLRKEVESGNLELKQRIGFAILGQGFLTTHVWGKGNGLFNQAYSVEDTYPALSRITLERAAIACTWDSRIMNFEFRLWHHFLLTDRSDAQKRRYLETFISGDLEDEAVCATPPDFLLPHTRG